MISIPKNLQNENLRFILINPKNKIPSEKSWQNENNYEYNSPKLLNHLENGGNYGVLTGNDLVVIDADEKIIEELVNNNLPKTFSVKTGSGGKHFYFKSKINKKIIFFDYDNLENGKPKHLGELQTKGQQVVGPSSIHPNGNRYEIIEDVPLAELTEELIFTYFRNYIPNSEKEIKKEIKLAIDEQELVDNLDLVYHLSILGFDVSRNPTKCVWHDMQGNGNFSFDRERKVWHCFHCNKGGNIIHLYMEHYSISKEEAKNRLRDFLNNENLVFANQILSLIHVSRQEATELMVQRILSECSIFSTRQDKFSEMWIYREGIYIPHAKTYIESFCRRILGRAYKKQIVSEIIDKIQAQTYIDSEKLFINEDLKLIPVKNGLLNLETNNLEDFNPNYKFFTRIEAKFDINKKCLNIQKFFSDILATEEDVKVMQEIFGFLLYRNYSPQKAIMFTGFGRNGKSKTLDLMKRFIGAENCTNLSLEEIENNNFALSNLAHKLANLSGDISKTILKSTGTFKNLTGNDLISADRKFLPRLDFTNYAKLIFSANELPITYDITPAFFHRWVLIDFPYMFMSQKELNYLSDGEKKNKKLADVNILNSLINEDELSGLLNWAIQGLKRLKLQGDFSTSSSVADVKMTWQRKSSSLNSFIMDCVEEDYDSDILKIDFRKKYNAYCRKYKLRPESDKNIKYVLTTNCNAGENHISTGNYWSGIKIKEDKKNSEDSIL
jgi:P4 family phage/plasmid primase-like protien